MTSDITVLMKVEDIEGSSTLEGYDPEPNGSHVGWIPIESCSFNFHRDVTVADEDSDDESEVRGSPNRVDPLTVKRTSDFTTAKLLMWLANAENKEPKRAVTIDYVVPSGRYYLRYEIEGAELVSCSLSYQEPDDASETLVFTFDKVKIFQRPIGESGEVDTSKEDVAEYVVFEGK
ncbi:MAG: type VI secretion system tube protein Hcp [Planctomycetota bacterium]